MMSSGFAHVLRPSKGDVHAVGLNALSIIQGPGYQPNTVILGLGMHAWKRPCATNRVPRRRGQSLGNDASRYRPFPYYDPGAATRGPASSTIWSPSKSRVGGSPAPRRWLARLPACGDERTALVVSVLRAKMTFMSEAAKHVGELLKLPIDVRSEAAEALLISLEDEVDQDVEAAWLDEIQRRIGDSSPGIPAAVVFAEGRDRLKRRA